MASHHEVLEALREIAKNELLITQLAPTDNLALDLALDSIQMITLVVELENRFLVKLGPEDGAQLATVHDLVALIATRSDPAP